MREIDAFRSMQTGCEICGLRPVHVHHIRTRGAGGSDQGVNLISLCPEHHGEIHRIGRDTFAEKYGIEDRIGEAIKEERR